MIGKIYFTAILPGAFLFLCLNTIAQSIPGFTHYNAEDGLSKNSVNRVLQDKQGFIWVGTTDGLNRFDGINFTTYRYEKNNPNSLNHSNIVGLHEDKKGNIWIGTPRGINKYNPETQMFQSYLSGLNLATNTHHIIHIINSDSVGNIWCGSYFGLYKLSENDSGDYSITEFLHDPENPGSIAHDLIWEIFEDSQKNMWFGTFNGIDKLMHEDNSDSNWFKHFQHDPENERSISTNQVWELDEDQWGNIWIGTQNGVNKFDPISEKFTSYSNDPQNPYSLSHNYVFSLLVDNYDRLWVGTYDGGLNLVKLNEQNNDLDFTRFVHQADNPHSISSNEIKDLWMDRSGILWIGTYNGLEKIDPNENNFNLIQVNKYDAKALSSNFIQAIYEDSFGNLWVGTRNGGLNYLNKNETEYKNSGYKNFLHDPDNHGGLVHNDVYALFEDSKNRLWIGTYAGISLLNLEEDMKEFNFIPIRNEGHVKSTLTHNFVFDVVEDKEGIIWIATYGGLTRLKEKADGQFESQFFESDINDSTTIINSDSYTLCLDANDDLWIGTFMGLCVFRKDSMDGERKFSDFLKHDNIPSSLQRDEIHVLYRDSFDYIWAGTIDGLTRIYIDDQKKVHFQSFSSTEAGFTGAVYSILEDADGNLWVSGNNGITVFNPVLKQVNQAGNTSITKNYDVTDGLQGNEFVPRAAFVNQNNEIYFGGKNGMNFFNPKMIKNNPYFPPVRFTDFRLFYKSVNPGSPDYTADSPLKKSISHTSELELKYWQNIFSIEFVGLNYTHSSKNKYRFKLEGFDTDWVNAGNANLATYTNLNPGKYIFKVMASNNDGIWNPNEASLAIYINPPPWKTWWAFMIYLFIFGLFLFVYNNYRTNKHKKELAYQIEIERAKLKEREQIRRKNAADFHDELGYSVTKITLYAEMANRENKPGGTLQDYLGKISSNVKALSGGIRDFIWALDPDMDSLSETLLRLQEFGDSLFEFTSVKFLTKDIYGAFDKVSLVADTRRHIVLIFKEAMNNSLKYSGCKTAELRVRKTDENIQISFSDDGEGFDPENIKRGSGLKNMMDRAQKINAVLKIVSNDAGGTIVILYLPLSG